MLSHKLVKLSFLHRTLQFCNFHRKGILYPGEIDNTFLITQKHLALLMLEFAWYGMPPEKYLVTRKHSNDKTNTKQPNVKYLFWCMLYSVLVVWPWQTAKAHTASCSVLHSGMVKKIRKIKERTLVDWDNNHLRDKAKAVGSNCNS